MNNFNFPSLFFMILNISLSGSIVDADFNMLPRDIVKQVIHEHIGQSTNEIIGCNDDNVSKQLDDIKTRVKTVIALNKMCSEIAFSCMRLFKKYPQNISNLYLKQTEPWYKNYYSGTKTLTSKRIATFLGFSRYVLVNE